MTPRRFSICKRPHGETANDFMAEVEARLFKLRDRRALIFWGLRDQGFPHADLERLRPEPRTIEPDADHFFVEDAADPMVTEMDTCLSSSP